MSKTTTLHVHRASLYISLPSLHNYEVKWPNFELDCSQSPIFSWDRLDIPRLPFWRASGIIAPGGGGGGEKIFLASSQTAPAP